MKVELATTQALRFTALSVLLALTQCMTNSSIAQVVRSKAAAPHRTAAARPVAGRATAPAGNRPPQASSAQVSAYLNRLRGKIIREWIIPDGNNRVTLTGNFNQDGLSDNLKTVSSPRNENAEGSAMQAFNKCMPLETPPLGMTNGKLTVDFVSKADPHGDSSTSVNLRLDPAPAQPQATPQNAQQPAAQAAPQAVQQNAPQEAPQSAPQAAPQTAPELAAPQTAVPQVAVPATPDASNVAVPAGSLQSLPPATSTTPVTPATPRTPATP